MGWGPAMVKFLLVCDECPIKTTSIDLTTNFTLGVIVNTIYCLKVWHFANEELRLWRTLWNIDHYHYFNLLDSFNWKHRSYYDCFLTPLLFIGFHGHLHICSAVAWRAESPASHGAAPHRSGDGTPNGRPLQDSLQNVSHIVYQSIHRLPRPPQVCFWAFGATVD